MARTGIGRNVDTENLVRGDISLETLLQHN